MKIMIRMVVVTSLILCVTTVHALDRITIGYYLEWPTPNLVDGFNHEFVGASGMEVAWKAFETGEDMNRAMAKGDIQIAYAQEFIFFLKAVSDGYDFVITGIALEFPRYHSCIINKRSTIRKSSAKNLEGEIVATLPGSVSHFRLVKMLEYLGVDSAKVEILPLGDGASVARALYHREVVMGCAFGAPVDSMLKKGRPLLSPNQMAKAGLRTFDVVMMSRTFLDKHREIARSFMESTALANSNYADNPDSMRVEIAEVAGMYQQSADIFLDYFDFPTPSEQLSEQWLGSGGLVETYARELAAFLVSQGKLETAKDDYAAHIYTGLLN